MSNSDISYHTFESDFLGVITVEFKGDTAVRTLDFPITPELETCLREVCQRKNLSIDAKDLLTDLVDAYCRQVVATGVEDPRIADRNINYTERCMRLVRKWADSTPA